MPMQRKRKWHSLGGRSVNRRVFIVIAAATLSAAVVGLVLGLWWLVSYVVLATIPQLVHSQPQANFSVMSIMLILLASLGAWLASIFPREKRPHIKKHRRVFLHPRLHH